MDTRSYCGLVARNRLTVLVLAKSSHLQSVQLTGWRRQEGFAYAFLVSPPEYYVMETVLKIGVLFIIFIRQVGG